MKKIILNHNNQPILLEKYVKGASCPTCKEGIFVGRRDFDTFKFLIEDHCLLCGQTVIYKTIPNE